MVTAILRDCTIALSRSAATRAAKRSASSRTPRSAERTVITTAALAMPMMNITTISSTNVKPCSLGFIFPECGVLSAVNIRIFILATWRAVGTKRIDIKSTIFSRHAVLIRAVPWVHR